MKEQLFPIIIESLELDENYIIQLNDDFRAYDNWDSLAQLSLIAALDETFGIQIEQEDFNKLVTVGDLLAAVEKEAR